MLSMFKGARKALSMALALSVLSCTNGLSRRRNEQHDPYHAPRYHAEPDPEPASGAQVEGEGSHRGVVAEHEARGCEAEATGEGEVNMRRLKYRIGEVVQEFGRRLQWPGRWLESWGLALWDR